jgi:hypothetical protein
MNAIKNTASTSAILAIDLGKYKTVAWLYDNGSGEIRFETLAATCAKLRRFDRQRAVGPIVGGGACPWLAGSTIYAANAAYVASWPTPPRSVGNRLVRGAKIGISCSADEA